MKFSRKLIVRGGQYGSISVPKPVLDAWSSAEDVVMEFDESSNTLVIMPKLDSGHDPLSPGVDTKKNTILENF
jgi:hypothetical protein